MTKLFASVVLAAMAVLAWAGMQTGTLSAGMTCAAGPITVKTAITRVDGVSKTGVSFDKREAVVSFDDTRATSHTLMAACANAGYLAAVKQ